MQIWGLIAVLLFSNAVFAEPCEDTAKSNVNHLKKVGEVVDQVWFWEFGGDDRLIRRKELLDNALAQQRINPAEYDVLINRDVRIFPEDMLALKSAACEAYSLSMAICGRVTKADAFDVDSFQDEETDALRHLILSGLINEKRGRKFTIEYLTAHEAITGVADWDENDPRWQQPDYARVAMDLHNNKIGRSLFVIPSTEPVANRYARQAVKELIKKPRRVRINREGNSRCASEEEMKKLKWKQVFKDAKLIKKSGQFRACDPLDSF
jgi:hypothetical protein